MCENEYCNMAIMLDHRSTGYSVDKKYTCFSIFYFQMKPIPSSPQVNVFYKTMLLSLYLNTVCWNKAARRSLGWVLDPPFSMWQWLRWNSENVWVLTGNPMDFLEIKQADRNASEYHLNHCYMEKWFRICEKGTNVLGKQGKSWLQPHERLHSTYGKLYIFVKLRSSPFQKYIVFYS